MIHRSIETARLKLDPLEVGDAAPMVSVLSDSSLYAFTGGEAPTLDELWERYRRQVDGSGNVDELWCNWIIRTKVDQRAVGFVQATVVALSADIAWVVGVQNQQRGVATEAARAVRDWLTCQGVTRIEAHIHPAHAASQAVAERIGMSRTGEIDDDDEEVWTVEHRPS